MARTSIKCSQETRKKLKEIKAPGETWDECLSRLAQLHNATQLPADN